jgi:hypothetical protein
MITLLIATLLQSPSLPPQEADTSPFRRLELPAPSLTRGASGAPGPGYWQQRVDYDIHVSLDTTTHEISGLATVRYRNHSPDTLRYLWFHLEQNLFRPDSRGAALNARGNPGGMGFAGTWYEGTGIAVGSVSVVEAAPGDTSGRVSLGTRVNGTLLRVDLEQPLGPQDMVTLEVDFHFRAPEEGTFRTAHAQLGEGRVYEIAQWYPRLAVYDDVRGWNTDQYLGNGEFYLEFGDFDVYITVPRGFIVAAPGILVNAPEVLTAEQRNRLADALVSDTAMSIIQKAEAGQASSRPAGDGPTLTWHFRAERVRDFAWATAPHFRWDAVGWHGILAQSFYPATAPPDWTWQGRPPDSTWAHSAEIVRSVIQHYSEKWLRYPYPTAINVHGPTGSMEYPMLCFCGTGAGIRDLTAITLHEMAHQWFPMIVGSNEYAHAWMDEGFANFLELQGWRAAYPGEGSLAKSDSVDYWTRGRSEWGLEEGWVAGTLTGRDEPLVIPPDRARTGWSLYFKPKAALHLLRDHVLADTVAFDTAFREYIRRWAFKHPTPADFFRTMDDALGEDLSWFWRGAFFRTDVVDLAVDSVVASTDTAGGISTRLHLTSYGGLPMPVPVHITFADGTSRSLRLPVEVWHRGNHYVYALESSQEVTRVALDPEQTLPDIQRENNVWVSPRWPPSRGAWTEAEPALSREQQAKHPRLQTTAVSSKVGPLPRS